MPRLLPMELHRSYTRPPKTLPRVAGHHADWLQAWAVGHDSITTPTGQSQPLAEDQRWQPALWRAVLERHGGHW